jgi:hypothetical protein
MYSLKKIEQHYSLRVLFFPVEALAPFFWEALASLAVSEVQ